MSIDEEAMEAPPDTRSVLPTRRSLLKLGGSAALGLGAFALAACETSNNPPGTVGNAAGETSVLDKWLSTKTAKLGRRPDLPADSVQGLGRQSRPVTRWSSPRR